MNDLIPGVVPLPFAKRVFDVIFSTVFLVVLAPVMLLVLLAMALEFLFKEKSRGPFFYAESRISQGKPFQLYKFRIFKQSVLEVDRSQNHLIHTKELEKNGENLTAIGKILKQSYLDELPQLFNVWKGDMTLVGPRPTNEENARRWLVEGKYSKTVFRAGLTGYFQSHKGVKFQMDQNQADMDYIEFCKREPWWKIVFYDMKILIISILTILRFEGI